MTPSIKRATAFIEFSTLCLTHLLPSTTQAQRLVHIHIHTYTYSLVNQEQTSHTERLYGKQKKKKNREKRKANKKNKKKKKDNQKKKKKRERNVVK